MTAANPEKPRLEQLLKRAQDIGITYHMPRCSYARAEQTPQFTCTCYYCANYLMPLGAHTLCIHDPASLCDERALSEYLREVAVSSMQLSDSGFAFCYGKESTIPNREEVVRASVKHVRLMMQAYVSHHSGKEATNPPACICVHMSLHG
jgi:hypothetical protein